ncbi:collagen, type I, alpha 1a-like [Macrobrachium nipponense]|uniref:collagen, type I, alpha 1a-like n=1 Tax=Macrobrachium nipponense TaxID=159736 RepID=UPI0030C83CDE
MLPPSPPPPPPDADKRPGPVRELPVLGGYVPEFDGSRPKFATERWTDEGRLPPPVLVQEDAPYLPHPTPGLALVPSVRGEPREGGAWIRPGGAAGSAGPVYKKRRRTKSRAPSLKRKGKAARKGRKASADEQSPSGTPRASGRRDQRNDRGPSRSDATSSQQVRSDLPPPRGAPPGPGVIASVGEAGRPSPSAPTSHEDGDGAVPILEVGIGSENHNALLDSGACVSLIEEHLVTGVISASKGYLTLHSASGHTIVLQRTVQQTISLV